MTISIQKISKEILALSAVGLLVFSSLSLVKTEAAISQWQKGVNMFPMSNSDFGSSNYKTSLKNFANLGGNQVTLVVPLYQSNIYSTDVRAGWNTPTDESLASGVKYAKSLGMKTAIKVFGDAQDGNWRAFIDPSDRAGWFYNYSMNLKKYASIAQAEGVDMFVMGTEMINMTSSKHNPSNTGYWKSMIKDVRSVYAGQVTYGANWDNVNYNEKDYIEFFGDLDVIGLSAYFHLTQSQNPSVGELVNAWDSISNSQIKTMADKYKKPIIFTEFGYKSMDKAFVDPGDSSISSGFNENNQANGYEAMFSYFSDKSYMKGVQIWDWQVNPNAGGQGNIDFTPQNKKTEQVMKKWFMSAGTEATNPTPLPKPQPTPETILQPTPTQPISTPSPTSGKVNIWWPTSIVGVSGTQPFKAELEGADLANYKMYWQVDGDVLNEMSNSNQEYPHKESIVNLDPWNWRGNRMYKVNFVAKSNTGTVIAQKSIDIKVN